MSRPGTPRCASTGSDRHRWAGPKRPERTPRRTAPNASGRERRRRSYDKHSYLEEENLVTDLVPSEMACLESSPGRMRRTAVWISRDEMVDFLL